MSAQEAGFAETAYGTYTGRGKDPAEIHRDIRHTRDEMSETFDAIGDRLDPDYLKEQAKDALRSTAHDARKSMIDNIKENPFPAAVAGLSLAWLFFGGSGSSSRDDGRDEEIRRYDFEYARRYNQRPDPRYRDYRRYPAYYARAEGNDGNGSGSAFDNARETASDAASSVGSTVSHATDQAREYGQDAYDAVYDAGQSATNWLQRQMDANPLAVGAVALAGGALVGLAVPSTHAEDEWMGQQSDRVIEHAKDAASEKVEQAKSVAETVAEEAKEDAKDLKKTAKQEAKKEDLDEPPSSVSGSGSSGSGSSGSGSSGSGSSGSGSSGSTTSGSTRKTGGTAASGESKASGSAGTSSPGSSKNAG